MHRSPFVPGLYLTGAIYSPQLAELFWRRAVLGGELLESVLGSRESGALFFVTTQSPASRSAPLGLINLVRPCVRLRVRLVQVEQKTHAAVGLVAEIAFLSMQFAEVECCDCWVVVQFEIRKTGNGALLVGNLIHETT